ncbi:hypothetical protein [Kitasatospora atroaurantiaca]|uniref:DUF7736 domain-containing protein n=1 Tax=Kitasatospora atroaurantiaca TaxID=285545 RepID=A0A561ENA6_9ACTN|nr:hypothetical protein [Kitasatospora atroaurantiaca]TWE17090.1 hypothetical protein FB465_2095 [Kitasatospora atroaurantiaca]
MTTRVFPLADILSVTTEKLLSRRRMDGVADLLNWMTGDRLEIWQMLRASDECEAALVQQHPFLAGLKPPQAPDRAELYAWLVEAERVHGEQLEVAALTNWVSQDPAVELLDRIHLAKLAVQECP